MDKNFATNSVDNNPSLNCNINQINNNLFPINSSNNTLNNNNNNNNINAMKNINNFNVNKSHTIRDICESNHKTQQNQKKSAISSQSNLKSQKISGHNSHQRQGSNQQMSATYFNNCNNNPSMDPLLDRTPCGSATLTPHFDESYDTPPFIRWQQDFHYLINDEEGIQLFQKYLKSEGLEQLLDFWFACEGLKTNETEDKEIIRKLINIIYKKFIRNSKTIELSDKVRAALKQGLTTDSSADQTYDPKYDKHVFDSAQNEVEEQLKSSIYVNFLRSDIYLNMQSIAFPNSSLGAVGGSYDESSFKDSALSTTENSMTASLESTFDDYNIRSAQNNQYYDVVLPTVDEESELQTDSSENRNTTINSSARSQTQNKFQSINPCHNLMSSGSNDFIMSRLNKIVNQRSADNSSARLTTELHPSSPNHNRGTISHPFYQSYLRSKQLLHPPNPYHVKYSTVLPTSARDSELQSLSSHSTNDSMSCVSGQDGSDNTAIRNKKQQNIAIKHNAKLNASANYMNANNTLTHPLRLPRSLPPQAIEASYPEKFALKLIEKLTKIKKERESRESNDKKLTEVLQLVYIESNANKSNPSTRQPSANPSEAKVCRFKEILKERVAEQKFEFCPPEDNDQEILDKHCEQVFRTPNETPTDSINRCVSPPKQHSFRAYDHRTTPPVCAPMTGFDTTPQINVTVKYSTEQIPYRLQLTGSHITLRRFKQLIQASLPAKRGNWQYYFKRKCDDRELIDISAAYVLEKITDDNVLLPLIDGKIFAELQESN